MKALVQRSNSYKKSINLSYELIKKIAPFCDSFLQYGEHIFLKRENRLQKVKECQEVHRQIQKKSFGFFKKECLQISIINQFNEEVFSPIFKGKQKNVGSIELIKNEIRNLMAQSNFKSIKKIIIRHTHLNPEKLELDAHGQRIVTNGLSAKDLYIHSLIEDLFEVKVDIEAITGSNHYYAI